MKIKLVLCMGSSCYARGNEENLDLIRNYIEESNITEYVDFRGQLCTGNCKNGPVLRINEEKITDINTNNIEQILDEKLIKLIENKFNPTKLV